VSAFRWYRRWRGGRWARVAGMLWGHRWVRVTDGCLERVDEEWGVPDGWWVDTTRPMPNPPMAHRIYTDERGHVWHAWQDCYRSGAENLTASGRRPRHIPRPA
jgi:hypothetical protein